MGPGVPGSSVSEHSTCRNLASLTLACEKELLALVFVITRPGEIGILSILYQGL